MSKSIQDGRDAGAFITSDLDDFGLDPYAFRIYGRIARRAGTRDGCFESIDRMAKSCRIDRNRVYEALKTLLRHNLIVKEPRTGKPSHYWLTPREDWIPISHLSGNPDTEPIRDSRHHLSGNPDTTYLEIQTPPIRNSRHKGNPSNRIPLNEPHQGNGDEDEKTDFQAIALANKAANLAKKQIAKAVVAEKQRNFIEDSPWGELAKEMGKDPKETFNAFKSHLEAVGKAKGKDVPEDWAGAIANAIFQIPGSELNNTLWLEFEAAYRKGESPQTGPKQNSNAEWVRLAKELGHITAFNAELQTCTVPGEGRRPLAELQAKYSLDYLKNQLKRSQAFK